MFNAKERKSGSIVKVYAVEGVKFLIERDGAFAWVDSTEYAPVDDAAKGPVYDSALTVSVTNGMNLTDIIAGITTGKIELAVGSSITTRMKNGQEVDFVVTDVDDEAYRFESRDCMGRYDPMTEIEKFYSDMWDALPDALRENIIDTTRYYKTADGEMRSATRKLFLPSASEIFPPDECYGDEDVYTQMEWYKDVHNRIRAFEKGGASDWYWTQSPRSGSTAYWCTVAGNGNALSSNASLTNRAAPVCFRIRRI